MRAGRLRRRITLQKQTRTPDGFGGEIVTWSTVATVWAGVQYGSGSERVQSLLQQAEATVAIVIRYRADVASFGAGLRIVTDRDETLDVMGVSPDERRTELTLACRGRVL